MPEFFRRLDPALLIAAGSGIALALAFPRPDIFPLSWVALVPLLLVMGRRPFATGFVCGGLFFALVLYWLNIVMTTYGGLQPVFSLLAYLFLIVYLACYFGAATGLTCLLGRILKLPPVVILPPLWVALEYLRANLLTGFPWALLGYSQQNFSTAIQSADVTGVYGVSFLLVAVNCALAGIAAAPKSRRAWLAATAVLLLTSTHLGYGWWKNHQINPLPGASLRVALIQGNIDQTRKWLPEARKENLDTYLNLSRQAASRPLDLLIWPEAATPFFFQEESPWSDQVRQLTASLGTALLFGSPAFEAGPDGGVHYYNSAYLLSSTGRRLGRSDKVHLVPFGEYVPLSGVFSFINKMVVGVGDFSPGTLVPLQLNDQRLGVLICYEAIFPQLARDYVRQGSRLLINLTNDAWFGRSSAPYQHLAMARFRAIENRIWLARAANTGVSALISPEGEITTSGPIFEPLCLYGRVGLEPETTIYTRYGDFFAFFCIVATIGFCFMAGLRRRVSR